MKMYQVGSANDLQYDTDLWKELYTILSDVAVLQVRKL